MKPICPNRWVGYSRSHKNFFTFAVRITKKIDNKITKDLNFIYNIVHESLRNIFSLEDPEEHAWSTLYIYRIKELRVKGRRYQKEKRSNQLFSTFSLQSN